jgi:hypothetical protein
VVPNIVVSESVLNVDTPPKTRDEPPDRRTGTQKFHRTNDQRNQDQHAAETSVFESSGTNT